MSDIGQASPEVETAVGTIFGMADAVRSLQLKTTSGEAEAELLADRLVEVADQLADDEGVDPARFDQLRRAFCHRIGMVLRIAGTPAAGK